MLLKEDLGIKEREGKESKGALHTYIYVCMYTYVHMHCVHAKAIRKYHECIFLSVSKYRNKVIRGDKSNNLNV